MSPDPAFSTTTWIPGQCWFHRYSEPSEPRCPRAGIYGTLSSYSRWTRSMRWCVDHKSAPDRLIPVVPE